MGVETAALIVSIAGLAGSGIKSALATQGDEKDRQALIQSKLPDRLKAPLTGGQKEILGKLQNQFAGQAPLELPFGIQPPGQSSSSQVQALQAQLRKGSGGPNQAQIQRAKSPFLG